MRAQQISAHALNFGGQLLLLRQRSVLLSIFQFMIGDVLVIKQEIFLSVCMLCIMSTLCELLLWGNQL